MGHLDVAHLTHTLPDGRVLLEDVSFRVGDGAVAALVGPNGAGKTTLLRFIAGDLAAPSGTVAHSGGIGVMRQFIGTVRDGSTVRDLLLSIMPSRVRAAATALEQAELAMVGRDDERRQLRYARALVEWGDAGGYEAEVVWDACCVAAFGASYDTSRCRAVATLSGGEQKRLVLEALLRGPDQVLLLDEPDNYLDVPGKQWLEHRLRETPKTVLLVSHDRELLARVARQIITVEAGRVWVHGGGFAGYAQARHDRNERLDELRRRWDEEHARLREIVRTLQQRAAISAGLASRYHAAQTRLRRFTDAGPPQARPPEQTVTMRLRGGRTAKRAVLCDDLQLHADAPGSPVLMHQFSTEIWFGERVAVLGSNGTGKSHFLRLLAGQDVPHTGAVRLGPRVVAGLFAQTHTRPDLHARTPAEIVMSEHARLRNEAMAALARYELAQCGDQPFETLSGGQQARLQILLLELSGATLLLLDEPTDNFDPASAEALQDGLDAYAGTVLAVTHDRWFARSFDRFLVFGGDGSVHESGEPEWDETGVAGLRRPSTPKASTDNHEHPPIAPVLRRRAG